MPAAAKSAPAMGGKAAIGLVGLAVGLVVGYGAGRVSTGTPINPLSDTKGGYEAGYRAAMQKVQASGLLPPSLAASSAIEGKVLTVSQSALTVEADNASLDPAGTKDLPKTRTVAVGADTEIVMLVPRTPEEFEAAQRAFAETSATPPDPENPAPPPLPPTPYKEVKISLDQVKAGDRVNVLAADDILTAASFEAVRVIVLAEPATDTAGGTPPPETAPLPEPPSSAEAAPPTP